MQHAYYAIKVSKIICVKFYFWRHVNSTQMAKMYFGELIFNVEKGRLLQHISYFTSKFFVFFVSVVVFVQLSKGNVICRHAKIQM